MTTKTTSTDCSADETRQLSSLTPLRPRGCPPQAAGLRSRQTATGATKSSGNGNAAELVVHHVTVNSSVLRQHT